MKIAVIGSRNLVIHNLEDYLPKDTTEIVSGGAQGIDACVRNYAQANGLELTEFLPDYDRYGKRAPLVRNQNIIDYADQVIAFWDGQSNGTRHVIDNCRKQNKKVTVHLIRTDT